MHSPQRIAMNTIAQRGFELSSAKADSIYKISKNTVYRLPLFMNPAAIPYEAFKLTAKEGKLDLNEYLIPNPMSTFLIRVTGTSMIKAGINSGDILVVDREVRATNGKIVVAAINDELLVKRIRYNAENIQLLSENDAFPPITITEDDKFDIWGVVKSVIKTM